MHSPKTFNPIFLEVGNRLDMNQRFELEFNHTLVVQHIPQNYSSRSLKAGWVENCLKSSGQFFLKINELDDLNGQKTNHKNV